MSTDQVAETTIQSASCMESVNRISKLPVVEQTIQTAQNIYGKVKDYNSVTNWTLQTAENTAYKAVEVAKPYATPVIKNLEGPIKKVDDVLCSGLDYVESKVPAVKLPPKDMYNNTKEYYNSHVTPAVETAMSYAEPAVKTARDVGEAAVEKALYIVDPVVEPIMENVKPIVDNVKHRVDDYLQRHEEQRESQQEHQQSEQHHKGE